MILLTHSHWRTQRTSYGAPQFRASTAKSTSIPSHVLFETVERFYSSTDFQPSLSARLDHFFGIQQPIILQQKVFLIPHIFEMFFAFSSFFVVSISSDKGLWFPQAKDELEKVLYIANSFEPLAERSIEILSDWSLGLQFSGVPVPKLETTLSLLVTIMFRARGRADCSDQEGTGRQDLTVTTPSTQIDL